MCTCSKGTHCKWSTKVASMVLRIDDVIAASKSQTPPGPPGGGGVGGYGGGADYGDMWVQ